ncbi:YbaN family protein [Tepidiforma sp.]|uniref:YbaN family protein n=1 Tax=Tepidiforma sp. TaxID=2682230 RepID=UPI002ADDF6E7|nr:YbaN family protein [Tepidiforma sp.]
MGTEFRSLPDLADSPAVPSAHRVTRWVLVGLGSLLVGIGVLGIFLPLLPSTVFFLGAAAAYGRSSPRAYRWLTTNRWFGQHLRDYKEERGATLAAKAWSIGTLWAGIGVTEVFFIEAWWLRLALLGVAGAVTLHLLTLRTIRR